MNVIKTSLEGLLIIEPQVFGDDRGYFFETYRKSHFHEAGIRGEFVQDNESKSVAGIIRGLHMQLGEYAQGKLVRVTVGRVMDVAVDCRPDSPTYGQHQAIELSDENKRQLWIPRGFAHGYESLEDGTIFCYKCDSYYAPEHELGIIYNDPDLAIPWHTKSPALSKKDAQNIAFKDLKSHL